MRWQKIIPQHLLTRLLGSLANLGGPLKNAAIKCFIDHYGVNMQESLQEDYRQFSSFNDFFTRALKPDAREIELHPDAILSPCDGAVSQFGAIEQDQIFQAKGHLYSLMDLLAGDRQHADLFVDGSFLTAYLSPKDYHRVHMPVQAQLLETVYVPGSLFSVNPETVANLPNLFARNERLICYFQSEHGPFALIMVGAMIVAAIHTIWGGCANQRAGSICQMNYAEQSMVFNQAEEMGHFQLGSTVILLFGSEWSLQWKDKLSPDASLMLGQTLATIAK